MAGLDDWRVFVAVATQRSFVGAARQLRRSPQAITRAVAALERRLGARLLHRTTRSVALTADGAGLLEQGRRLLAEFDALESPARADAPVAGTLSITAPVLCASPGYLKKAGPLRAPGDLALHACIAFTATTPSPERWTFHRPGSRASVVAVRPRLVVNTGQAAIDAAIAGLGVVRVLSYQVEDAIARGRLVTLLENHEPAPLPVQLLRLAGPPSRAQSAFLALAGPRLLSD
jgi:DNA-binding transcriptional LysR family regulator